MGNPSFSIVDLAAEIQDAVLDLQQEWLTNLSVSAEIRRDVFEHLCLVTGMALDALIYPEKLDVLMSEDS
jgi:hypothetical protein